MGKKRGHPKPCVGRQHRKLHIHPGGAFRIILHPTKQFLTNFIAHRVRNNNYRSFLNVGNVSAVEVPLKRNLCHRMLFLDSFVPFRKKFCQVLVCIYVLYQRTQCLKGTGFFHCVTIKIELTVLLVDQHIQLPVPVNDVLKALRSNILADFNQMKCAVKKLVCLLCLSAKVHFHTLFADGRNIIAVQLSAGVLSD